MIACVYISNLIAHIEGRNPVYAGKPVILIAETDRVQGASLEATRQGVRMGMTRRQAQAQCPDACLLPTNDLPYLKITEAIGDVLLQDFTPNIELITGFWKWIPPKKSKKKAPAVPDASAAIYYLDLGRLKPTDGLFIVNQLKETLATTFELSPLVGLASNKFTAGVAVHFAKPDNPKLIHFGFEARFLSPLSVAYLKLDKETARRMSILGIKTLGQLAKKSSEWVFGQFGNNGRLLHQLAQGKDEQPVPLRELKPKVYIQKVLDGGVEDKTVVESILEMLGSEIGAQLTYRNLMTSLLDLTLHLDDGSYLQTNRILPEGTANGKLVGRNLMRLFNSSELSSGVVEIDVMASELTPLIIQQLDIFGTPYVSNSSVTDVLYKLTARFGDEGVYYVRDRELTNWLPEKRYTFEKAEVA